MSPDRGPAARLARAALTYLAEPGDPALGALLEVCEPGRGAGRDQGGHAA